MNPKTAFAASLLAWGLGPAAAQAPAGPMLRLDDTGMARCVVDGAFTRACKGTGQDGEHGRDAHPGTRSPDDGRAGFAFERVCGSGETEGTGNCPANPSVGTGPDDWACTRDLVTGLLWEIKQSDGSIRDRHDLISMQNWGWGFDTLYELQTALDGAAVCGSTTWQAPTLTELLSIVDYALWGRPVADARYFPNTPTNREYGVPYPTLAPAEGLFTGVNFIKGTPSGAYGGQGTYARLVTRPTGLSAAPRYAVSADGTQVADRWTHLAWQRCRLGTSFAHGKCVGRPALLSWADALAAAALQPGWRLPNLKELVSMTTLDEGWLDHDAYPNDYSALLWSSTPFAADPSGAWQASFDSYGAAWATATTDKLAQVYLVRDE